MEWLDSFLNWQVGVYLMVVVSTQVLLQIVFRIRRLQVEKRRTQAGLPPDLIMDHAERLSRVRWEAGLQGGLTMTWPDSFLNWQVGVYLLVVVGTQVLLQIVFRIRRLQVKKRRTQAGLPPDLIMDHAERLSRVRWEAGLQGGLLLFSVFVVPLSLLGIECGTTAEKGGLLAVFIAILVWILLQGTDVAKAFLGGLAFKTLVAFQSSIQVGDRVTLKGYSGKVLKIGTFFVTLQTVDDDLVNIPSGQLWSEVLVSANAGERSSLCVMEFHLAPFAKKEERQSAEDAIWESIQASPFCETAKPMQIYLSQEPGSIRLTAKAYVTSTYDEPLFKSDVSRAFLDLAAANAIPLASGQWSLTREDSIGQSAHLAGKVTPTI